MKFLNRRFRIPHLELTAQDGRTLRIPWTEISGGSQRIFFEQSIRRTIRGLPFSLAVTARQALAARLLRQRAEWRVMDHPCKFLSITKVSAICGGYIVAGILILIGCFHEQRLLVAPAEWNAMLPEIKFVMLFVGILLTFAVLALCMTPLIVSWPYLRFRIKNPAWKSLWLTSDALVVRRRDGFEERLLWTNIVSFDDRGKLLFADRPDDPIQIFIFENSAWRLIRDRLNRTHADKRVKCSNKRMILHVFVTLAVSAVAAELVLAYILDLLEMNHPAPGILLACAMLLGCCLMLIEVLNEYARKRSKARLKRKTNR